MDIIPGLFVTVRIPLERIEDARLIPEAAVGSDQAGRYVWVVGDDNAVARADVQVGAKYEDLIVITKGLEADDWVVIDGIQRVRSKAKVAPERTTLPDSGGEITTVRQAATLPAVEGVEQEAPEGESPATPAAGGGAAGDAGAKGKRKKSSVAVGRRSRSHDGPRGRVRFSARPRISSPASQQNNTRS